MADPITLAYIAAGLVLPMFNLPQIVACALDREGLRAYSLTKTLGQIACRFAMLPFIVNVGNETMVFIVLFDLVARVVELVAALHSLRATGWTWNAISRRLLRVDAGATRWAEQHASREQTSCPVLPTQDHPPPHPPLPLELPASQHGIGRGLAPPSNG